MSRGGEAPGNVKTWARLYNIGPRTRAGMRHAWFDVGDLLKAEANRAVLHDPKTGRVYYVRGPSGRRRRHRSSSKKDSAHANLTGALRRSIGWHVIGSERLDFGYGVAKGINSGAPRYAPFVEGDPLHRETLSNALEKMRRQVEQRMAQQIDQELEK